MDRQTGYLIFNTFLSGLAKVLHGRMKTGKVNPLQDIAVILLSMIVGSVVGYNIGPDFTIYGFHAQIPSAVIAGILADKIIDFIMTRDIIETLISFMEKK